MTIIAVVCDLGVGVYHDVSRATHVIEVPSTFAVGNILTKEEGHVWTLVSTCPSEIAGVLSLDRAKTHGRASSGRLLYEFRPADKRLPSVLVPCDDGSRSFSKHRADRYIMVAGFPRMKFENGRLHSVMTETIGTVGEQHAYDVFQLAKNGLRISNKHLTRLCRDIPSDSGGCPSCVESAFTIDPEGCRDFDDAFSVVRATDWDGWKVSVHISDVAGFLLENKLLGQLPTLRQSVYLTTQTKNMLPNRLSNTLLSLVAGATRRTLAFDFKVQQCGGCEYVGARIAWCAVSDNFVYDTEELTSWNVYKAFQRATAAAAGTSGMDSHEEVAWWMVRYNAEAGNVLARRRVGIYRACDPLVHRVESVLQKAGLVEVAEWTSEYRLWGSNIEHGALRCSAYAQSTSPIRRYCDIVNQWLLRGELLGFEAAEDGFYTEATQISTLQDMNDQALSAKRSERASRLMYACCKAASDAQTHRAVCVSSSPKDSKGVVVNDFYLPELRLRAYVKMFESIEVGEEQLIVLHRKHSTRGEVVDYSFELA